MERCDIRGGKKRKDACESGARSEGKSLLGCGKGGRDDGRGSDVFWKALESSSSYSARREERDELLVPCDENQAHNFTY
jgi:hypothetical protein